jgi:hypothetical protein
MWNVDSYSGGSPLIIVCGNEGLWEIRGTRKDELGKQFRILNKEAL